MTGPFDYASSRHGDSDRDGQIAEGIQSKWRQPASRRAALFPARLESSRTAKACAIKRDGRSKDAGFLPFAKAGTLCST